MRALRTSLLLLAIAAASAPTAAADEDGRRNVVATLLAVPAYLECGGTLGSHRGLVHARIESGDGAAGTEVLLSFFCPTTPNQDSSIEQRRPRPRRYAGLWPGDRLRAQISPCTRARSTFGSRSLPTGLVVMCVDNFERIQQ